MDINMTLVVQMLVFAAFVWFTMKFVWPPICKALDERQAKIAEGLAAADRGKHELELAQKHIKQEMKNAKVQVAELLDKAHKQAAHMVEEARNEAKLSGTHMIKQAQEQIELEVQHAKKRLRTEVAELVMSGMEKVIQGTLPEATKKQAVDQLISDISKE